MAKPLTKEEFYIRHSAYFQQIGFDVQFAGGIYYLLSLGDTELLEYETKDDFVIYKEENTERVTEYYQVKHTSISGTNMTDGDGDFWKSIDNWLTAYDLSSGKEKDCYFSGGRFIILTNKRPTNFLNSLAKQLRDGDIELSAIKDKLNEKIKSKECYKDYVQHLLNIGDKPLRQFLMKMEIRYFEDFIKDMYAHFIECNFNAVRSDSIVKQLMGSLFYHKTHCAGKFSFTGKQFRQKFKTILEQVSMNEDDLTMESYNREDIVIPSDFSKLMMVKQLKEIKAVRTPLTTEDEYLMDYLTRFYLFQNAFHDFEKLQLITPDREKILDEKAYDKWFAIFKTCQDDIIQKDLDGELLEEREMKKAGRSTLNAVMNSTLEVNRLKIDQRFSNGWFLSLSNRKVPVVMWHYLTYKKYKK